MSKFTAEYKQFFESPAGLELLTWITDQRASEHDKAEKNTALAGSYAATAKAYREVLGHIDSVQVGVVKPNRSSSGADA